jgi:hypothetical protein
MESKEVRNMRKTVAILGLLSLAFVIGASPASADGVGFVDYSVTGTFAAIDGFSSTSISTAGDSFTFSFSVDPALLGSGPLGSSSSPIDISFDYTDTRSGSTIFSLTGEPGTVTFNSLLSDPPGLFDIDFFVGGDHFVLFLTGTDAGFIDGTPPTLNTGKFTITDGVTSGPDAGAGSIFGDFDAGTVDAIAGGTVKATQASAMPEPSSLLLLGSGFLALGSFARKRLFQRNA